MTYEAATEVLKSLNARVYANVCPKVVTDADVPAYVAWQERTREINAEARAHGFRRIFDGSFCLNIVA